MPCAGQRRWRAIRVLSIQSYVALGILLNFSGFVIAIAHFKIQNWEPAVTFPRSHNIDFTSNTNFPIVGRYLPPAGLVKVILEAPTESSRVICGSERIA